MENSIEILRKRLGSLLSYMASKGHLVTLCPYCEAVVPIEDGEEQEIELGQDELEIKFTCSACGKTFYE